MNKYTEQIKESDDLPNTFWDWTKHSTTEKDEGVEPLIEVLEKTIEFNTDSVIGEDGTIVVDYAQLRDALFSVMNTYTSKTREAGRLEGIEAGLEEGMIRETKRILALMDKFNFVEKSPKHTEEEK